MLAAPDLLALLAHLKGTVLLPAPQPGEAEPLHGGPDLKQVKGQGTLRKPPEHVLRDLSRHLDAVQALVDPGPYLLGDVPYLCDFALWGQLNYLRRTPVGGKATVGRQPIERYMERMAQPASRI